MALIEPSAFPTHIARVVARLNVVGHEASGDTFLMASYVVESLIKTVAVALCAGVKRSSPRTAYRFEHDIARADGLGSWESMIGQCTGQSYAGYVDSDLQPLLAWLTKKRTRSDDEWTRKIGDLCASVLRLLDVEDAFPPKKLTARHLLSQLVQIRNKTKAHGAVGPDFFEQANDKYLAALELLLEHCPVLGWEWYHVTLRPTRGSVRAISLRGPCPRHLTDAEAEVLPPQEQGIHFRTHDRGQLFHCGELIRTTRECKAFRVANGGFTDQGYGEFIDYADGSTESVDLTRYLRPPAPLPPSATEGELALDVYSNVLGNLPPKPKGYVQRPRLQEELVKRLLDRNHPIVTLHGRGGIGKTSLALFIAHTLAEKDTCDFDHILWFSARDLELRPTGPAEVRRAVPNLDEVCKMVSCFLNIEGSTDAFASMLENPNRADSKGLLFIFDNFETLDDPRGLHKFLDTHTHIPNKILITSRERAFKGDYPIEVGGMEWAEALELMRQESRRLQIEGIVTDPVAEAVFEYTDGHAYVMRVLLGEIARDGRYLPLKSLVPRRSDLLNAVFERSFNRLSPEGRWVFLTVAGWRSIVLELALLVVLGLRDIDAEAGIEECFRLSLVIRHEMPDGQFCYTAPELAGLFARKKLEGDPDRLVIEEDLALIQQFGTVKVDSIVVSNTERMVATFVEKCFQCADKADPDRCRRLDEVLVSVAELWPKAWPRVAEFRKQIGAPAQDVAYAYRRGVEESPYDTQLWLDRAEHAGLCRDEATRIASLVSAVEAKPSDVEMVRDIALQVCKYVDAHKGKIPPARRGVYLASVRDHMEKIAPKLDATGLSRLAWLFILEGNLDGGWKYANMGLSNDSGNTHCLRIVERLDEQGYKPSPDAQGTYEPCPKPKAPQQPPRQTGKGNRKR